MALQNMSVLIVVLFSGMKKESDLTPQYEIAKSSTIPAVEEAKLTFLLFLHDQNHWQVLQDLMVDQCAISS